MDRGHLVRITMSKKKRRKGKRTSSKPESNVPVPSAKERRKWKSRILLISVFVGVLLLGAALFYSNYVFRPIQTGFASYKNHNVLLITIDTLRADHLPLYGYNEVETPHIDRLAKESLVFQDAIAHVPLTLPSHASILTGLLPPSTGVRDNAFSSLDPKVVTLAETLRTQGYTTAAFVSAVVLDSEWQIDQGFELYFDHFDASDSEHVMNEAERRGEESEVEIERWLSENRAKKFFLWAHYYDPHDPYEPPEPYKSNYATHPYDGEIAYTDSVLGKLFDKLQELGLKERTIIVLTGDHGESLGEHGELTHSLLVYESVLHVPLLIYLPKGNHHRIKELVRHIDIAPTLLEWLGVQSDSHMQGQSLIPLLEGKEKQKRIAYSESKYGETHYGWSPLESITTDEYRLINAPTPELYDRKESVSETKNLIHEKSSVAKVLQGKLNEIIQNASRKDLETSKKIDPETEEKLRSLGYITGTVQSTDESRKIDPKDKVYLHRALTEAYSEIKHKNNSRVIELLTPVLKEGPNMIEAHYFAGIAYAGMQQFDKAIHELLTTIRLRPDYTMALYNLAYAYQSTGDYKEAEVWYKQIFKYTEKHPTATIKLAQLYRLMNQPEKARTYFLRAVNEQEESLKAAKGSEARSKIFSNLAEIYFGANELDRVEENLQAAIKLTPAKPGLHYNLAQVYEAKNDSGKAVEEYKKETEVNPSSYMAFHNLGLTYRRLKLFQEAIDCFRKELQIVPGNIQASYFLAETYVLADKNLEEALVLAQNIVRQKPEFKEGRLLLASIYKKLGRNEEADQALKTS